MKACRLCGRGEEDGLKAFRKHHIDYEKDSTRLVCFGDHCRLHGTGRFVNKWWEKEYGKDKGPLMFAKAVVRLYKSKE
jgi:hypothetical protein